jgi:hypothetical protein
MSRFCTAAVEPGVVCGAKSENRELGLCATHNRARLKSEKPVAPKKVYQMPRATAPINPISSKKAVALRAKAKAYAVVDTGPRVCVSCGCTEQLTHSHVLTVGQFPEYEATPENILLECQPCHMVWEHDKHRAAREHASWGRKMAIMEALAPRYFARFQDKFPALFPVTQ